MRLRDGGDGAGLDLRHRLFDNAQGLAHLLDSDVVPIPAVPVGAHRDTEVKPVVYRVRLRDPHVLQHSAGPQCRSGHPQLNGVLPRYRPDALGARDEHLVLGEQLVALLDSALQVVHQQGHPRAEVLGQVLLHPADPDVVVHHPGAGDALEKRLDALALAKPVEDGRHRARIQPVYAVEEHVAGNAVQLAQYHTDVAGPVRYLQVHQLLHRQTEGQLAVQIGDVVQPVEQSDRLAVQFPLAQLLGAPVEVADVRLRPDDPLPVDPQQQPEHAVGARMLGPHIHHQVDGVGLLRRLLLNLHLSPRLGSFVQQAEVLSASHSRHSHVRGHVHHSHCPAS